MNMLPIGPRPGRGEYQSTVAMLLAAAALLSCQLQGAPGGATGVLVAPEPVGAAETGQPPGISDPPIAKESHTPVINPAIARPDPPVLEARPPRELLISWTAPIQVTPPIISYRVRYCKWCDANGNPYRDDGWGWSEWNVPPDWGTEYGFGVSPGSTYRVAVQVRVADDPGRSLLDPMLTLSPWSESSVLTMPELAEPVVTEPEPEPVGYPPATTGPPAIPANHGGCYICPPWTEVSLVEEANYIDESFSNGYGGFFTTPPSPRYCRYRARHVEEHAGETITFGEQYVWWLPVPGTRPPTAEELANPGDSDTAACWWW